MKKTLISLLLVVALLFATAVPAFAEVKGKLSATATPSGDGTSFTVNLFVKENSGFISLKVEAKYDSKVLKLKSAKNGEVFEDFFITSETTAANPYQIIWMEATADKNIKTNGLLASYTFEVLNTAPVGNTEITFEVVDVVDVSGDTKRNFNTCTFKANVNGNQSSNPQSKPSGGNTSNTSKNEVADNEILDLQKPTAKPDSANPDSDKSDSNQTVSDESPSNDDNNESTDNEVKEDLTTNSDETNKNNGVVTTVIVVAAVLVLAAGATAVALYLKKKRANK